MLICVDCQRTNAPWAKKCAACGSSLQQSAPSTLIVGQPDNQLDEQAQHKSGFASDDPIIQAWDPDTEWHSLEHIDSEKILDPHAVEPITVIDPSRTAEIDWGDTASGLTKFASTPFPGVSKDRFDEYGYDFGQTKKSAWKTTAVLLAGIAGILVAGGLAINYLHSTTQPTTTSASSATASSAKTVNPSGKASNGTTPVRGAVVSPAMTEEILYDTAGGVRKTEFPNTAAAINAPATSPTAPISASASASNPPVFVRSASDSISASSTVGITATPEPTKSEANRLPQSRPVAAVTAKISKGIAPRVEAKQGPYPVLVPTPQTRAEPVVEPSGELAEVSKNTAAAKASDMAATPRNNPRLREQQSNECSNSAFLGKVVCEERSRVNFCRNRWNEHPDCQLNNGRIEQ
jgi:hypothetical protein